jgi:methionine-rich copper-binding protein CopC
MKTVAATLFATLLGVAGVAAPALAAGPESPRYVTSDPGDGAEMSSAPARVTVTFSEPLDESSSLHVYDECGQPVDAGDTQVLGSRMDVGVAKTPSGHYTVVYDAQGFGGATGETKDDFSFHVTSGSPCGGGSSHHHHGGDGDGSGHEGHPGGGHSGHDGGHGTGHGGHEGAGHDDHSAHGAGHDGHATGHDGHTTHDGHARSGHSGHGAGHHAGGGHHDHGSGLPGVHDLKGGAGKGLVQPRLAAGAGGLAPNGRSVLIALGLSIVMGALGGLVLRASAAS